MWKRVTYNELVSGLLLKFARVDRMDLSIMVMIFNKLGIEIYNYDNLSSWQEISDSTHILQETRKLFDYKQTTKSKDELKKEQGSIVPIVLKEINVYDFVLKKIKVLSNVFAEGNSKVFSKSQLLIVKELIKKGYVNEVNENSYIITKQGLIHLFMVENKDRISNFIKEIKRLGYDSSLFTDYLMLFDFNDLTEDVFNIDNFASFCDLLGHKPKVESKEEKFSFTKLKRGSHSFINEKGMEIMRKMLSIYDKGHFIYICALDDIFVNKELFQEGKINWQDIDIKQMFMQNNYGTFKEEIGAFNYVKNRLTEDVHTKYSKYGLEKETSYLVVIEVYHYEDEDNYLVRGIISKDLENYGISFNQEYLDTYPSNSLERKLRFNGQYTPRVYIKTRKK